MKLRFGGSAAFGSGGGWCNLKLLKTGAQSGPADGLGGAAEGLDLMVGCYSDSSLLNGAAAQLLPLIRWPDLDSHLNLVDDPFAGLVLQDDRLRPSSTSGLGIRPAAVRPELRCYRCA